MPARTVPLLASGAKLSEPEAPTNSGLVCTFLVALVEIVRHLTFTMEHPHQSTASKTKQTNK